MRAVIQRVTQAGVLVEDQEIGSIGPGLVILLGVSRDDSARDADYLAQKIVNLRIFEDEAGKMNLSLLETGGQALIVSQFTLWGDCRKGRRPSFSRAARPGTAEELYLEFVKKVGGFGVETATGRFGAMMRVRLVNDGPVTLIAES